MAQISAAQVKALRERTGLPMMDCKAALIEAEGDADRAIELLRKRGELQATKKAGRETGQGRIGCAVADGIVAIVEFRCESAPVANSEDFAAMVEATAAALAAAQATPPDADALRALPVGDSTVQQRIFDTQNRLRENMQVARFDRLTGECIGRYVHFNGQVGVLLGLDKPVDDALLKDLCMHVAFTKPEAIVREEVPAAAVEAEREIFRSQAAGKPDNIIDKIVAGKLNKWFAERVLIEQPFVKDDKVTVGTLLQQAGGASIAGMRWYEVGQSDS